ncbi:MAG: site-specific DNA-methyltransferase [Candidatus Gracilibacteria bacterium]|nr:site-specific DNA-methyltransferase [Candidatus Gracilibacteria bacterium]
MFKEENLTKNNTPINNDIEILKTHFSHCFDKNGDFDFDKFKKEISKNEIDFSRESYSMDWLGKSYARVLASEPARTLLKEDKEWNKKEENKNSENLLIKGDNLEVLKHLSNAYHEKVKMIYIDPPYNTGSDGFVYQDDRKFDVKEFSKLAGVDEEKSKRILDFVDSKSNSHSAWLTFMYPRLYIAKQLLKDDGVIFVSIDDNEVSQLKILMDEIFGEENFIAELPTIMNLKGNNDQFAFSGTHEYTLVYSTNKTNSKFYEFKLENDEDFDWEEDDIGFFKKGSGLLATSEGKYREDRPYMYFPILLKNGCISLISNSEYRKIYNSDSKEFNDNFVSEIIDKYEKDGYAVILPINKDGEKLRWTWGFDGKFKTDIHEILCSKTNNGYTLNKKQRPSLGDLPTKKPKTIFYKPEYSSGNGTSQIKKLFNTKMFSNPKPFDLIKDFIQLGISNNDIILDFFAGSGTTGDAVMQLNSEDSGTRKYILVQIPELIDKEKNKIAYDFVKNELGIKTPTIFEITKERLVRAGKKIKEEKKDDEKIKNLDFGFKIFETTHIWEDYNVESQEFSENLKLFDETQLKEEDIQTLLTTWKTSDNIALTQDLEKIDLDGYTSYYFQDKIYLMNKGFETKNLKSLLEKIDSDKTFEPKTIIAFGYHFESKNLREIAENIKAYSNKKNIDIDFITRY